MKISNFLIFCFFSRFINLYCYIGNHTSSARLYFIIIIFHQSFSTNPYSLRPLISYSNEQSQNMVWWRFGVAYHVHGAHTTHCYLQSCDTITNRENVHRTPFFLADLRVNSSSALLTIFSPGCSFMSTHKLVSHSAAVAKSSINNP